MRRDLSGARKPPARGTADVERAGHETFHDQPDGARRLRLFGRRGMVDRMAKLLALWSSDLAVKEAFWTWTVTVGLPVNLATSVLFLVLILQDQPLAAVVAGYAISVPYNIVATVGVWRSAARYTEAHRSFRIWRVLRASASWRS